MGNPDAETGNVNFEGQMWFALRICPLDLVLQSRNKTVDNFKDIYYFQANNNYKDIP
jgi:hypothetical protein